MGRKGLKTVSIVILVIGVFCLLVCIAVGWGGEQLLEEKNLAMSLSDFIGSLALSLLGAGLALATGILGLRLAVQGKGACACKVMGVLLLVFQAASSVINLLGGDRSAESVLSMILCVLLTMLYLIGVFCVKADVPALRK